MYACSNPATPCGAAMPPMRATIRNSLRPTSACVEDRGEPLKEFAQRSPQMSDWNPNPVIDDPRHDAARVIRAPRGSELSCKNWIIEAAYRMIQNNLDAEVAED